MNKIKTPITLELAPSGSAEIVNVQGDYACRILEISLTANGQDYTPESTDEIQANFRFPLGDLSVFSSKQVNPIVTLTSSGKIELVIPAQALTFRGNTEASISIIDDDGKLTTESFTITALRSVSNVPDWYKDGNFDVIAELKVGKQDKLTAGDGIAITNNVISAIGGGSGGTSNYNQLTNKPKINNVELSGNKTLAQLGINNFSGNYNDLSNKPTIPSISGLATESYVNNVVSGKADVSSVPTKTSQLTNDSDYTTTEAVATQLDTKQDTITSTNKLDYSLIANQPTIPSLDGYATKTYVDNHHDNTKADVSAIPTVPTNVSAFTNDSGYLTLATLPTYNGEVI